MNSRYPGTTVAELGESGVLELISHALGPVDSASQHPTIRVGVGDDAAVVDALSANVVICADTIAQDRHFKLSWSRGFDIGARVVAANCADIAAMGAQPRLLVISLTMPATTAVAWVLDFLDGAKVESGRAGAQLVGGDLNEGEKIIVTGVAVGDMVGREPVTRSGARIGDVVAIAGQCGESAAGLALLQAGVDAPTDVIAVYRCPQPPYQAGVEAADAGATSMIDVSDGLVIDLERVASASNVTCSISSNKVPTSSSVPQAAERLGRDPKEWILAGGEDHCLAATFPAGVSLPASFVEVGRVVERRETGVLVDGEPWNKSAGFDHFRARRQ